MPPAMPAPFPRRLFLPALLACFFLSGAAGLIDQVVWSKALGLVFGHTAYAVATVLAVFMGGLAAGSALFARRAILAAQRVALVVIERANLREFKSIIAHLHDGPALHELGELLDRETDGLGATDEEPIAYRPLAGAPAIARINLGRRIVFKPIHPPL